MFIFGTLIAFCVKRCQKEVSNRPVRVIFHFPIYLFFYMMVIILVYSSLFVTRGPFLLFCVASTYRIDDSLFF